MERAGRSLLAPLLTGILLRCAWWALVEPVPVSDAIVYHEGALGIASGRGFCFENGDPNGFWPPGYSAFLSWFAPWTGGSFPGWFLPNLLLAVLLVWTQATLARACFGERAGRVAAWVAACYPSWVLLPTTGLSENLFLVLLTGYSALVLSPRGRSWPGHAVATVLLAAALLTRPTALVLPALAWVARALADRSIMRATVAAALTLALALALCTPWGMRQQRVFGEFTFSAFNGGPVLWMGNHDGPPTTDIPERFRHLGVAERHHAMKAEAMAFIRANPATYAVRAVQRTATALRSETYAAWWNGPAIGARFGKGAMRWFATACTSAWWLLAGTAVAAAVVRVRRRVAARVDAVLLTGVIVQSLPFVLLDSQNRYHAPLVPFLTAWAAWLLAGAQQGQAQSPTRQ